MVIDQGLATLLAALAATLLAGTSLILQLKAGIRQQAQNQITVIDERIERLSNRLSGYLSSLVAAKNLVSSNELESSKEVADSLARVSDRFFEALLLIGDKTNRERFLDYYNAAFTPKVSADEFKDVSLTEFCIELLESERSKQIAQKGLEAYL